jgi:RimJ/RimL family protein N-acetyltransferase
MENLNFDQNYILENDRVKLVPLTLKHFELLSTFALREPELWKYSISPGAGLVNLQSYIQKAIDDRANGESYAFIVFDKQSQKYAGSTRFYDHQKTHKTIQLGYTWYGADFQGTGLNKNCKYLLLEFAFEHLDLERVEFRADNKNERSIAAMKSIGCQIEGVLRNNYATSNGRRDSIILSILKRDWLNGLKISLFKKLQKKY